jgi:hypothetical protein
LRRRGDEEGLDAALDGFLLGVELDQHGLRGRQLDADFVARSAIK